MFNIVYYRENYILFLFLFSNHALSLYILLLLRVVFLPMRRNWWTCPCQMFLTTHLFHLLQNMFWLLKKIFIYTWKENDARNQASMFSKPRFLINHDSKIRGGALQNYISSTAFMDGEIRLSIPLQIDFEALNIYGG